MSADLSYVRPGHLQEVLPFLWEHGHETTMVAGGTDVLIALRARGLRSRYLLDISRLAELRGIAIHEEGLSIGAGVTLAEIYSSKVIASLAPSLQEAAFSFGSAQIRNTATIGGNVANASPSGDTVPPLLIHNATALLASVNGERSVPVATFFTGPYRSVLRPDEIIVRFILEPAVDTLTEFQKVARRQAHAIARISIAMMAAKESNGTIALLRVALGSCTPWPRRMKEVEHFLTGTDPDQKRFWQAGRIMAAAMVAAAGRRTSTVYKEKAVQGLLFRMLCRLL